MLSAGRGAEVFRRRSDHSGREGRRDLDVSALQELEKPLGVLLLLVRRLLEDRLDLDKSVLLRLRCEVRVAVSRLRFPGERLQQVFLRSCSFQLRV